MAITRTSAGSDTQLRDHPGNNSLDLAGDAEQHSDFAAPRRCSWRSPNAAAATRPCAAGHRAGRAPPARSRCPGEIAPPTYCPCALTTSKVVAVPPKSTTMAGPAVVGRRGRERVDDPVGADLARVVHQHRDAGRTPGLDHDVRDVGEVPGQHLAPLVQHRRAPSRTPTMPAMLGASSPRSPRSSTAHSSEVRRSSVATRQSADHLAVARAVRGRCGCCRCRRRAGSWRRSAP